MKSVGKAFERQRSPVPLRSVPNLGHEELPPYEAANGHEMPPMMFQVRFRDGCRYSFPYSDISQIYQRDAGHVELTLLAKKETNIVLEGRNLDDMVALLGMGRIRWLRERDYRTKPRPDEAAELDRISMNTQQS